MSLVDDVERDLLALLDPQLFGSSSLVVDNAPVVGVFAPDETDQAGNYPGQIAQRYRLVCRREDLVAEVGEELDINGQMWVVVQNRTMGLLTDLVLLRYTA
jgi:hypothetical protein